MKKRPLSIIIIGWIFIAAGAVGLVYHATEINDWSTPGEEAVWILIIRFLAIVGGVFLLRGRNWARWLIVVWLGYHVILSFMHTPFELIMHGLLTVVIVYFLFWTQAAVYFRDEKT